MIELIVEDRCTGCGDCVKVCPTHVFDLIEGAPVIARPQDCQTCFMCELYCKPDAIYVGADRSHAGQVDEPALLASGLLGQYRRDSGWDEWAADPRFKSQFWRMGPIMNGGREASARRQELRAAASETKSG